MTRPVQEAVILLSGSFLKRQTIMKNHVRLEQLPARYSLGEMIERINKAKINQETKIRIFKIARELGYLNVIRFRTCLKLQEIRQLRLDPSVEQQISVDWSTLKLPPSLGPKVERASVFTYNAADTKAETIGLWDRKGRCAIVDARDYHTLRHRHPEATWYWPWVDNFWEHPLVLVEGGEGFDYRTMVGGVAPLGEKSRALPTMPVCPTLEKVPGTGDYRKYSPCKVS